MSDKVELVGMEIEDEEEFTVTMSMDKIRELAKKAREKEEKLRFKDLVPEDLKGQVSTEVEELPIDFEIFEGDDED